jgi:hypothetical protein
MALGALAFAVYLGLALVAVRVARGTSPAALVVGLLPLGWALGPAAALSGGEALLFWPFSATYAFLSLSFLLAFGAVYKSVSLRILADLLSRPGRADRYDTVVSRYLVAESYRGRVEILTDQGFATRGPAGLRLTRKGWRLAHGVRAIQTAWKIERSG